MLTDRQRIGLRGEQIAARWLVSHGWSILDRRFRDKHRDIDLIVSRPDDQTGGRLVAFVEVRSRGSIAWGTPIETVRREKQQHLSRSARRWILTRGSPGDVYRFDVLGVLIAPGRVSVQYVPDAFWLDHFG